MSTIYYEGELPVAGDTPPKETRKVEIIVSDFYGPQELYLRVDEDEPRTMRLTREQAREFLSGLEGAMSHLGYVRGRG